MLEEGSGGEKMNGKMLEEGLGGGKMPGTGAVAGAGLREGEQ